MQPFRGLISGREIVNTLKSRTTNPFNDISAICLKRPGPPFDANTAKSRARAVRTGGGLAGVGPAEREGGRGARTAAGTQGRAKVR